MRTFLAVVLLLFGSTLFAQQSPIAIPGSKVEWTQVTDVGVTVAEVQGYIYRFYPNSSTTGLVLSSVICTGVAPTFVCNAPIPTLSQGNNNFQLTAANVAGESVKSAPFAYNFVVAPRIPSGIRILPPPGT